MHNKPRIATFDNSLPFHIGTEIRIPTEDKPINWSEFINEPKFEQVYENGTERKYRLNDQRAIEEIHRLLNFQTCPICGNKMKKRKPDFYETILICLHCGFWGGRGSRMDNVHEKIPLRGVLGFYNPLKPLKDMESEYLITHLKKHPEQLPKIGPRKAEKFVIDLLADTLDCEVKLIGGTRDKGVDGYIIKNDNISSIIQVKWRESINGAESVKVIREVAGTLLARGIPSGILISNKDHFSKDAQNDAELISKRELLGLGKMDLTLLDYHNIIDMLEISNTKLTANMKIEDWIKIENAYDEFEGAMMIDKDFVDMFI